MIVSDRVLYLHVPKTGGMSVTRHLLGVLPRPVLYTRPEQKREPVPDGVVVAPGPRHETLAKAQRELRARGRSLDEFAAVLATIRNPYDLEVSHYAWLRLPYQKRRSFRPPEWELAKRDFTTFAREAPTPTGSPIEEYFVLDGEMPSNLVVLRFEQLESDLAAALARVGLRVGAALPRLNASNRGHYASYYTPEAEEAVFEKYRWVFEQNFYERISVTAPPRPRRRTPTPYERSIPRVRNRIAALPGDDPVLVVTEADERFLRVPGKTVWHFPRTDEGVNAGRPADGAEAVAHLRRQRRTGARWLVLPAARLWWLDYYPELHRELGRYRPLEERDPDCVVFDLSTRRRPKGEPPPVARGEPGLVSVVIPTYNHARFLGDAIESVLAQTYPHVDTVVVDDGSTDRPYETVVAHHPRVRYVRQRNQGLSGARNRGLAEARGSYVVFLDADDRLLPEALETGLNALYKHPECVFVSGHYRVVDETGAAVDEYEPDDVRGDHYAAFLRKNSIGHHGTVVYRRAVFDEVGGFDVELTACEDYDLYLRIARRFSVCRHVEIVAEYRRHEGNMSDDPERMLRNVSRVLESQRQSVRGRPKLEAALRAGVARYSQLYGEPFVASAEHHLARALRDLDILSAHHPTGEADLARRLRSRNGLRRDLRRTVDGTDRAVPARAWAARARKEITALSTDGQVLVATDGRVPIPPGAEAWHVPRAASPALERLRRGGARYLVFAQESFALLDRRPALHRELLSGFQLVDSDTALVFDLERPLADAPAAPDALPGRGRPGLVSVVIPTYNQADFLGDAIESALAQTYGRVEIVVVDDGSADRPYEVVVSRYKGVRCVWQPNRGLAAARNRGLAASRGAYVVFLDADDCLLPNALLDGLLALHRRPDCAFAWGGFRMVDEDGEVFYEPEPAQVGADPFAALLRRNPISMHATVMYRRAVFDAVGGFDPMVSPSADYDLYLRVARRFPVCRHDAVVADYRRHDHNMSNDPARMLATFLSVLSSQVDAARADPAHERSLRDGVAWHRRFYGRRAIDDLARTLAQAHHALAMLRGFDERGYRELASALRAAGLDPESMA